MAFRDWLNPQAAIVAISAIDDKDTPHKIPTIATIATIAEVESTKQLAANDQEAQEEADWHEFLYGKSTEELLYNHLLTCPLCHVEAAQYCLYGDELGKQYDALLLKQEDAQAKRKALALQVDRACISGRRAFESLFSDNAPLPRQDAPITRKWGNTPQYEAFINHWTACEVCKPNLGRYCDEGQRLEKEANC